MFTSICCSSHCKHFKLLPVPAQGEPVPCAVQYMIIICCQCDAVLPVADCRQSCDSTWFARGAGWTKAKSSKNFYCCKCQLQNGWDMVVPTAGMWLCSRCAAVASASYEKDTSEATVVREQPSSSSSSYVGPLASTMLDEPYSDVLYMKPLRSLRSHWSGLPLSINDWGTKLRHQPLVVDDATGVWSLETSVSRPGLVSKDEEYFLGEYQA